MPVFGVRAPLEQAKAQFSASWEASPWCPERNSYFAKGKAPELARASHVRSLHRRRGIPWSDATEISRTLVHRFRLQLAERSQRGSSVSFGIICNGAVFNLTPDFIQGLEYVGRGPFH